MTTTRTFRVGPYELDEDLLYDPLTHFWAAPAGDGRLRCGFDPLGAETCGDIVAVSFEPTGSRVARGGAFGHVEAAKFVGPLLAPVGGVIAAHNEEALADPALLNSAPLETWLVEVEATSLEADQAHLLTGRAAVDCASRSNL